MIGKRKKPTEDFAVFNRWSGEIQFTAKIECDPDEWPTIKLGLAVKWGFANGARLDGASLDGASLVGASLVGASLVGASLVGARLDGARLDGALVYDKKIKRLIAIVARIEDPYVFHAFETDKGEIWIKAGCRWFSLAQYRAHVAAEYADRPKGVETTAILDFIEGRAKALGVAVHVLEAAE